MADVADITAPDDTKTAKPVAVAKPVATDYNAIAGAVKGIEDDPVIKADRARVRELQEKISAPVMTAPPPQPAPSDPLQAFGQPAFWIAAMSGLLTRQHTTNAIMAAAEVQKSIQKQDTEGYQRAYDQWKLANENAMKMRKFEQDDLKNAVSMLATDERAGAAAIQTHIAAFKNEQLDKIVQEQGPQAAVNFLKAMSHNSKAAQAGAAAIDDRHDGITNNQSFAEAMVSGDPAKQADALVSRAKFYEKEAARPKVTQSEIDLLNAKASQAYGLAQGLRSDDPQVRANAQEMAAKNSEITSGLFRATALKEPMRGSTAWLQDERYKATEKKMRENGTYTGPLSVEDAMIKEVKDAKALHIPPSVAKMVADRMIAGDPNALAGFGRAPELLMQLDTALYERMQETGKSAADIVHAKVDLAAYMQGEKAFEAGGKLEPAVRSLNTVVQHLGVLKDAASALSQNDTNALNKLKNTFHAQFGGTGPITFDAVKNAVAPEIEKAIQGSAGAVADRDDLKQTLSRNLSPEQLKGAVDGYVALMGGQLNSLRQTYERNRSLVGKDGSDFDRKFLSPEAQAVLTGKDQGEKGGQPMPFSSVEDADAAAHAGKIQPGQKVIINGKIGTWNP